MTVYINGTTGYSGPVGTIGDLTTTGNTTLGDASSDTLTLNGNTASIPNNLNFTGGNIGIGVTSPSAQLQVNKTGTSDYTTFRLSNSGASGKTYEIGVGGNAAAAGYANNLYFYDSTAGALRMILDTSGNLGLGVTPSTIDLGKFLEVGQLGCGVWTAAARNVVFTSNLYYNGGNKYATTGAAGSFQIANGVHYWYNAPSGTAGNAATLTQAMTLDASGYLGIGTTSPASHLHVKSSANYCSILADTSTSTGGGNFVGRQNGSQKAIFGVSGAIEGNTTSDAGLFAETGGNIRFYTNGSATEKARIDTGGRFVVGASTAGTNSKISCYASPFMYMCTTGGVDGSYERMLSYGYYNDVTGGNLTREHVFDASITAGAAVSNQIRIKCYSGGSGGSATLAAYFTGAGTVYNAGNSASWNTTSDSRIKENVSDISSGLSVITGLRPVTYDYTQEFSDYMGWASDRRLRHDGFIAQEYAQVLPDKVRADDMDVEGLRIAGLMSINQGDLIPYLVKAIQELKAEFDAYKLTHP